MIRVAVSVDQVGADVGTFLRARYFFPPFMCPSIRLVPTSAPPVSLRCGAIMRVSVDQVGADVGTVQQSVSLP